MKRKYALLLLLLAPLLLMGIGPFLAQTPSVRTTSTPVLGGELVTGWTNSAGFPYETFTSSGSTITSAINTAGYANAYQAISPTVGLVYLWAIGMTNNAGTIPTVSTSSGAGGVDGSLPNVAITDGANKKIFIAGANDDYINYQAGNGVAQNYAATNSLKGFSLPSLIAPTRPFSGSGRFYVTATTANCATGEWLGTATYLDSTTSPTKGLFAYMNRTTGNVELRVLTAANTWTSLINTAVTFSSGAQLVLVVDQELMKAWLFYGNAIVGTAQDVSAYTWIRQNRRHAIFSTTAVTPGSVVFDYGVIGLGSDLLAGWNFTSGWLTNGTGPSIIDANSFSTTGNGGVYRASTTAVGTLYKAQLVTSTTATSVTLTDTGDNEVYVASGQTIGYAIDSSGNSTLYVKNVGAGTTDVTALRLWRVQ